MGDKELLEELRSWSQRQRQNYLFNDTVLLAIAHMEPQVLRWAKSFEIIVTELERYREYLSEHCPECLGEPGGDHALCCSRRRR